MALAMGLMIAASSVGLAAAAGTQGQVFYAGAAATSTGGCPHTGCMDDSDCTNKYPFCVSPDTSVLGAGDEESQCKSSPK